MLKANLGVLVAAIVLSGCVSMKIRNVAAGDALDYMEDVRGEAALNWVRGHNERSLGVLKAEPDFTNIERDVRAIMLAKDRIPYVRIMGGQLYNFWQDAQHVRGIWRRTTLEEYRKAEPQWETVLDLDALAKTEGKNWVWGGADCLEPEYRRCFVKLSVAGSDSAAEREFDLVDKSFVWGGFELPPAKSDLVWIDRDTALVATDFGEGSLTESGYPRLIKIWKRGTPLNQAEQIFEGLVKDVAVSPYVSHRPEGTEVFLNRGPSFFEEEVWHFDRQSQQKRKLPFPSDVSFKGVFKGLVLGQLRSEWKNAAGKFPAGSLVALPLATLDVKKTRLLWKPDARSSLQAVVGLKDVLLLQLLQDVKARLSVLDISDNHGVKLRVLPVPDMSDIALFAADSFENRLPIDVESFLRPSTLYLQDVADPMAKAEQLKQLPPRFDASGLMVEQRFAKSKDGTKIPYFLLRSKNAKLNGQTPTLLYGYGGFEVSQTPFYAGPIGKTWLERGGAYALANIRGGGEYGPRWHQAALLEKRHKAFEDFIGVAQDLIKNKVTSPAHLGIMGGSNGGLLVSAVMVKRPDLFNAVVCQVPLADMLRYHLLLAGASWVGEYGSPDDPKMRPVLESYSPVHNFKEGVRYPEAFFVTSTADDRVHPAHARKLGARMEALGQPFYYYENIEGGHGAAANLEQRILRSSLEYTYLWKKLR